MRAICLLAGPAALLLACGPSPEPAPSPFASGGATSGDETEPVEEPEPVVMPSTTPVPVPQPAVAREQMGEDLQRVWMRTERAVEVSPPPPPTEATVEEVQAWAEGAFTDWMRERRAAVGEAEDDTSFLVSAEPYERGVTAALFGYMYEDTAASMRGAPVPAEIAADEELLDIYVETLSEALLPYAQTAAEAYATCAATFMELGDEAWAEWAGYCANRAREIVEVYELEVQAPDQAPGPAEDGGQGPGQSGEAQGEQTEGAATTGAEPAR